MPYVYDWGYFFKVVPEPFRTTVCILFASINSLLVLAVFILLIPPVIILFIVGGIRCGVLHRNVECDGFCKWLDMEREGP